MTAVLNTNVFTSALNNPHEPPADVVATWRAGRFTLLLSKGRLDEIEEVVARPRITKYVRQAPSWLDELLSDIRESAECVEPTAVRVVKDDPDDDLVLGTAITGNADYIVTDDKHLLALGSYEGLPIVTLAQFLLILASDS